MKSPVWHYYYNGVHHLWGILFFRGGILHLKRYRDGRSVSIRVRGLVFVNRSLNLLSFHKRKRGESTSLMPLTYFVRRPIFKLSMACRLFWRYLWSHDIRMCIFCGERFSTVTIPDPNFFMENEKEPSLIKVCEPCSDWVKDALYSLISGKRRNDDFWATFNAALDNLKLQRGVLPHG